MIDTQLYRLDCRFVANTIWLLAGGSMLVRALMNLLSNAVRYSVADRQVQLRVEPKDKAALVSSLNPIAHGMHEPIAARWLVLRIIDQGQGMTSEQALRLQHGQSLQHNDEGNIASRFSPDAAQSLGVGFVMARTVIHRHGGALTVESQINQGTTVTVWLPLDDVENT